MQPPREICLFLVIAADLTSPGQSLWAQTATFTVSPAQVNVPAEGGSGTFRITATPESASWGVLYGGGSSGWSYWSPSFGTGSTTINYHVDPNVSPQPRSTILQIGQFLITSNTSNATFSILQAGTSGYNFLPFSRSVRPFVGSANAQTFTAIYSDGDGASDMDRAWLLFNSSLSGQNSCFIEYSRTDNVFRLRNDADSGWAGSTAPGGFPSIQNSACEIDASQSSVTLAGSELTINVSVLFKPAFTGKRNIYLAVFDRLGVSSDWTCWGTWYPGPVSPVLVNRYRLFIPWSGTHLHTTDLYEYTYLGTQGYPLEGITGSIFNAPGTYMGVSTTPMYRAFSTRSRQHIWTTDRGQYEDLVRPGRAWGIGEGVDGFFVHPSAPGSFPLYWLLRCCTGSASVYHWTSDLNEYETLTINGWSKLGIAGYMMPAQ